MIEKISEKVQANILVYWPGNYGGDALADIIFGHVNPSGRLPFTYPRYPHSLINYWHKYSEEQIGQPGIYNYESDYNPLYEFGWGLSYTTFNYSNLKLSRKTLRENEILSVNVTVTNTGSIAGKEVVLLYTSDLYASIAPDMKRLRRFEKVFLQPSESVTVEFSLSSKDLAFVNINNQKITEPGEFVVRVGNLNESFTFQ